MKLSGQQIGELTEILRISFSRNELTYLIRTKLEIVLSETVTTDDGWKMVAFNLVDSLNREERAVELIRVIWEARPNDTRIIALSDEIAAQSDDADHTVSVDSLRKAIGAFNDGFEQRNELFGYLDAYKQLHDVLHELQSFNATVAETAVRRKADPSVPIAEDVVFFLRDHAKTARDCVAETEFPGRPLRWIDRLDDAIRDLTGNDIAKMLRAVAILTKLPTEELAPLNEKLFENASHLHVQELVASLDKILNALSLDMSSALVKLRAQVQEFRSLCSRLDQLTQAHNLCQKIDYDLHQVAELRPVTSDDPSDWVDAKKSLHDLTLYMPNDEKVAHTSAAASLFEAANQGPAFEALVARFDNLFMATDKALLKVTNKLPVKAIALHAALEKLR